MKKTAIFSFFLLLSALGSAFEEGIPRLNGPYLGQTPPGMEPQVFAPGIVSTGINTFGNASIQRVDAHIIDSLRQKSKNEAIK